MDPTIAWHYRLLFSSLGLLLLASYTHSGDNTISAHAPPTITLVDWPLHPQLPASFLATVDKVVITSFTTLRSEPPQPHALLVTKDGGVYLYGKSAHLGFGKKKPAMLRELEEFRSRPIRDAAFGKQQDAPFLLILTEEGAIWTMGDNSMAQLGRKIPDGTCNRTPAPSSKGKFGRIEKLTNIVEICAGGQHSLARDDQGRVFMWGYVLREEGIQSPTQLFPTDGSMDTKAVRISCGLKHSALVTNDNKIYSWGANHEGQLGTGNKIARPKPTLIPWQPEDGQIVQLTCGSSHTAVLTSLGNAYLWGANKHGQLGIGRETGWVKDSRGMEMHGSTVGKTKPTKLSMGSFDMIMASGQMTLGCTRSGQLYVWGQFGGRSEDVPFFSPVKCNRHRDLLRQGVSVDTGGMVAADTHAYGPDYTHARNMEGSSEGNITNNLERSLDGLFDTDNDNSDLGMRTVVGLVIGTILLMLAFITYYYTKRHEGELQPGDCLGQNNGDEHRHLLQQEQGGDPVGGDMGPGGGNLGYAVIGNDGPGAHREDRGHYEARRRQNVD